MEKYQPTLNARETARNIKEFIASNKAEFWKIFKPLMPFIIGFNLMDVVVTNLYMQGSEDGSSLGGLISSYFMVALVISWHRVVIHGADNYVPMNPFKPKRHEIMFIAMSFLIIIGLVIVGGVFVALSAVMGPAVMAAAGFVALIGLIYVFYRLCLYFPAKAVDAEITLKQAFGLSKGYLWKLMSASFSASLKMLLLLILYMVPLIAVMFGLALMGGGGLVLDITGFIMKLPIILYFQPVLTVIGVTALSNYYLYAIKNQEKAVEAE